MSDKQFDKQARFDAPRTLAIALECAPLWDANKNAAVKRLLNSHEQLERELSAAIRDRDARSREACTYEGRKGCSFAQSATLPRCKICGVEHGKVEDIDYDCPHQAVAPSSTAPRYIVRQARCEDRCRMTDGGGSACKGNECKIAESPELAALPYPHRNGACASLDVGKRFDEILRDYRGHGEGTWAAARWYAEALANEVVKARSTPSASAPIKDAPPLTDKVAWVKHYRNETGVGLPTAIKEWERRARAESGGKNG